MTMPDLNACHFGENIATMRNWPDEFVQTIVTSPPYYGLRDYGVPPTDWPEVVFQILGFDVTVPPMTCCFGLEPTWQAYIGHLVYIFREARRVLRPDGTLFLNLGDSYAGSWGAQGRQGSTGQVNKRSASSARQIAAAAKKTSGTGSIPAGADIKPKDMMMIPQIAALALRSDGWYLRQDIIWHKPNPMPESVRDRCTKAHEFIFLLTKSEEYFYDAQAIAEPVSYGDNWRNGVPDLEPIQAPGQPIQSGLTKLRRSGNKERKFGADRDAPAGNNSHQGSSIPWEGSTRNKRDVWPVEEDEVGAYCQFHAWKQMMAAVYPNRGDVWKITTEPTSFADAGIDHFATFPRALVRPCILAGTSEGGGCPTCGAPYVRQTKSEFHSQPDVDPARAIRGAEGQKPLDASNGKQGYTRGIVKTETTGWAPSCACGVEGSRPCIVLDLFLGSGTTGEVAQSLGRSWLGCDINPKYGPLQDIRTRQIGLL